MATADTTACIPNNNCLERFNRTTKEEHLTDYKESLASVLYVSLPCLLRDPRFTFEAPQLALSQKVNTILPTRFLFADLRRTHTMRGDLAMLF